MFYPLWRFSPIIMIRDVQTGGYVSPLGGGTGRGQGGSLFILMRIRFKVAFSVTFCNIAQEEMSKSDIFSNVWPLVSGCSYLHVLAAIPVLSPS